LELLARSLSVQVGAQILHGAFLNRMILGEGRLITGSEIRPGFERWQHPTGSHTQPWSGEILVLGITGAFESIRLERFQDTQFSSEPGERKPELGIDPCALKNLAERMKLDSSTVVGIVDRLVVKGLVVRNPDPQDRRRISLAPTGKGEEILSAAPHPAQGHLLVGLEGMDRRKVENLHEALGTLVGVLEAEHLEAPFFFAKE